MSSTFTRDPQPRVQHSGDRSRRVVGFPFPVLTGGDWLGLDHDAPAIDLAASGASQTGASTTTTTVEMRQLNGPAATAGKCTSSARSGGHIDLENRRLALPLPIAVHRVGPVARPQ